MVLYSIRMRLYGRQWQERGARLSFLKPEVPPGGGSLIYASEPVDRGRSDLRQ